MDGIERIKTKNFSWVHIQNPSERSIKKPSKEFGVPVLIQEELVVPTFRAKVEQHDSMLYLVFHFPLFNDRLRTSPAHELDIVLGKNVLITATYNDNWKPIEEFRTICAENPLWEARCMNDDVGGFLCSILSHLYSFLLRELDHVRGKIDSIEEKIFSGNERELLQDILRIRRDILDFRRTIQPHKAMLRSFVDRIPDFQTKQSAKNFSHLEGEYLKVWNTVENYKETIEALHETNESLLTTKTNEIVKVLTILAFITFPLMLIASIFGMNTEHTPIVGFEGDFWIILGAIFVAMIAIIVVFKRKRWI